MGHLGLLPVWKIQEKNFFKDYTLHRPNKSGCRIDLFFLVGERNYSFSHLKCVKALSALLVFACSTKFCPSPAHPTPCLSHGPGPQVILLGLSAPAPATPQQSQSPAPHSPAIPGHVPPEPDPCRGHIPSHPCGRWLGRWDTLGLAWPVCGNECVLVPHIHTKHHFQAFFSSEVQICC